MSSSCPQPDSCRFTGCQGDCNESFPAAACARVRTTAQVFAREIAWSGQSASPFKPRDPLAQRRLLVAS